MWVCMPIPDLVEYLTLRPCPQLIFVLAALQIAHPVHRILPRAGRVQVYMGIHM